MDPLADTQDLADRLETAFTGLQEARAAAIIRDASALVRNYTRQQFTIGTDTVNLESTVEQWLYLPQRPVVEVLSVSAGGALLTPVLYTVQNDALFRRDGWNQRFYGATSAWNLPNTIQVEYTHGYETNDVPDDIVAIVCKLAQFTWVNPGMLRQFTEGNMSATLAIESVGQGCLDEDDMRVLRFYRRPLRSVKLSARIL